MKTYLSVLAILYSISGFAQTSALLSGYNAMFYPSVLPAAKGVAMPFLLMQGYEIMSGVTVADSTITYAGINYHVHETYINPSTPYYVSSATYSGYGVTDFGTIWPAQMPNILYKTADTSFNAQADCVGYLTRLLSATGDTSATGNAYLNIIGVTHAANTVPFAYRGYVATAYSFAVVFPTLPVSVATGWQYIAGNVETVPIDTYDHRKVATLATYNGVRKGGFAGALPGDILAFGYSAASSSNGHVMVMETAPQLLSADSLPTYFPSAVLAQATALLATHNIYSIPVFDCSGQMAHFRDSRANESGIGHGTLLIMTDVADDAPTGFLFDPAEVSGSSFHFDTLGSATYAISVGRFVTPSEGVVIVGSDAAALQVFPNPGNELHILLPGNTKGNITVQSLEGRIVYQQDAVSQSLSLATAHWPAGCYIISYRQQNGVLSSAKWMKQ